MHFKMEVDFLRTTTPDGAKAYKGVSGKAIEVQKTMISFCYEGWFCHKANVGEANRYNIQDVDPSELPPPNN